MQMELDKIVKELKLYLFDMDGTLYLGDQLFDFTIALLNKICSTGGKYMFMTNNSSKSVMAYIESLRSWELKHGMRISLPPLRQLLIT